MQVTHEAMTALLPEKTAKVYWKEGDPSSMLEEVYGLGRHLRRRTGAVSHRRIKMGVLPSLRGMQPKH